jgi:ornithine carbamoyltransferase
LFVDADRYRSGEGERLDGAAVLFFPPSSLRTRVSFERGAWLMGLQPVTFPPETLSKDEDPVDVVGYLASWARLVVGRYPDIAVLDRMAGANALPIINAMTDVNHPCEVLSDLYALSRSADPLGLRYLFVGADANIGRAWWEGGRAFGLDIRQSCPSFLRIAGMPWDDDLRRAVATADVIITDGPGPHAAALAPYQITADVLRHAPSGVRLAPCPPFVRGREVSADAIDHPAFVGYRFKESLMPVQQAVMSWVLRG